MITPDKMSKLKNNKVVDEYEKLNQEITKQVINKIIQYDELLFTNASRFKSTIKQDKNKIFKDSLKKTRKLNTKTKKSIKQVFKKLRDDLNDNKRYNK
ncbi:MAG: hypothetical protein HFJ12_01540 [Bacilli bacterium]|nr:hypothetical protein [Bacilli bacterium]